MKPFDHSFLSSLLEEYRRSMKGLLTDLCDELEHRYPRPAHRLKLPVALMRLIGRTMPLETYSHWKFVGWIETLNDLVYFIDLHEQANRSYRDVDFVEQLYAECQDRWYEHGYTEELFPEGAVCDGRLAARIRRLCRRLANDVAQQALFWQPGLTCEWSLSAGHRQWQTACNLAPNFDRAEPPYALAVGVQEVLYHVPAAVRDVLRSAEGASRLVVTGRGVSLVAGGARFPIYTASPQEQWHWRREEPIVLRRTRSGTLTLGPTLIYNRRRVPSRVCSTAHHVAVKMRRALAVIEEAWPAGDDLLALLTARIVPLKASGVVSFSYRHQPGLSFINCFDRDDLDLVDDLIHENSHHQLNLLLRKYVLYREDCNREIFYSPWRRTLRPIRGILHASFTFAIGALLFERLSRWASGAEGRKRWRRAGFSRADLDRARFRCLEEVESVRYSLRDLREAQRRLGWITKAGGTVVALLARTMVQVKRRMARTATMVMRSRYRRNLLRHVDGLRAAHRRHQISSLRYD